MGAVNTPLQVKPFVAIMYTKSSDLSSITATLINRLGPVEFTYGPTPFSWSEYYSDEMGSDLQKIYLFFKQGIHRDFLPDLKNYTNSIEETLATGQKRTANIDPGYISRDKLVLASTKDFYHRLYLSNGIYGEVTLHFRKGIYRFFSWTYPDYKTEGFLSMLERSRATLVKEIRNT